MDLQEGTVCQAALAPDENIIGFATRYIFLDLDSGFKKCFLSPTDP